MDNRAFSIKEQGGVLQELFGGRKKVEFEKEVERWITKGILLLGKDKMNEVLPFMAVVKATK